MASVYQKRGHGPWYVRVKDAAGRWADIASRAKPNTEARPRETADGFLAKKAGIWVGANPITETESRRVPKRVHPTLRTEEIPLVLERAPAVWRPFTATAIYAGLRKGELCGLRRRDVDLDAGLITVRCSYDSETTKGGHADVIPIAPALAPYLQAAIDSSPSDLVFPWPDGSMRSPECDPEKVLRRALARAGLVERYDHS